jgi:O-antigen/teichoic acid export membrane protein
MKEELTKLAKHTGIYGTGIVLSKAIGFFMIPVYTHFLTPADYGVLELLDLIVFFVGIFASLGIYSAVFRFYAAYDSREDKHEVISTALLFVAASSIILATAVILAAPFVASAVLGSASYARYVRIVAVTLLFSNLAEVPMAYWRAQGRTVLYVGLSLGRTILGVSQLILFLVHLQWGVQGALYANLITNFVVGTSLAVTVAFLVSRKPSRAKLEEMLRYGAPLILQSLASFVIVFSDRFFLRRFASLTEVGVYSLGYKLAGIVAVLVSGPFSMAWSWQQFELAKHKDASRLFPRVQIYQFFVAAFLGLAVSILARDYLRLFVPATYWQAAWVVPIIVLCYIAEDIRRVILSQLLVKKLTHYIAMTTMGGAATALLFNYLLIPRYHAMGAAVATLLAYSVALTLSYIVSQRIVYHVYDYQRNALILLLGVAVYLISQALDLSLIPSVLTNITLLFLFLLLCFFSLDRDERGVLRQIRSGVARRLRSPWFQYE